MFNIAQTFSPVKQRNEKTTSLLQYSMKYHFILHRESHCMLQKLLFHFAGM